MSSPPFDVLVGAGVWHPAGACRVNHRGSPFRSARRGELFGSARRAPEARSRRAKVLPTHRAGRPYRPRLCAWLTRPGWPRRGEEPVIERAVHQRLGFLSVGCRASIRPDVEAKHIAPRGSICQDPDDWLRLNHECRALAGLGLDAEPATHPARQLAGDVEAQAGAARQARELRARPVELLENPLALARRNSRPRVADRDGDEPVARPRRDPHGAPAVLGGVVDEVQRTLLDSVGISPAARSPRRRRSRPSSPCPLEGATASPGPRTPRRRPRPPARVHRDVVAVERDVSRISSVIWLSRADCVAIISISWRRCSGIDISSRRRRVWAAP